MFSIKWKLGTHLNTLCAKQISNDHRNVEFEGRHHSVRRSVLHTVQNYGCPMSFNNHNCTDHTFLVSMNFPGNGSSRLRVIKILNIQSSILQQKGTKFVVFGTFISHFQSHYFSEKNQTFN